VLEFQEVRFPCRRVFVGIGESLRRDKPLRMFRPGAKETTEGREPAKGTGRRDQVREVQ